MIVPEPVARAPTRRAPRHVAGWQLAGFAHTRATLAPAQPRAPPPVGAFVVLGAVDPRRSPGATCPGRLTTSSRATPTVTTGAVSSSMSTAPRQHERAEILDSAV